MKEIKCLLKKINCLLFRRFDEISIRYKLTSKQLMLLKFVDRNSVSLAKEISQNQIEKEFSIQRSSVTSILHTLEKRDLVIRTTDSSDNRKKIVRLTDKAISIITVAKEEMNKIDRQLSQCLNSDEQDTLIQLLGKVYDNMKSLSKE